MDTHTAEIIVKVYAVLTWIGALFSFIGGIAMIFFGSLGSTFMGGMMGAGMMDEAVMGGLMTAVTVVVGIILVVLSGLYAYTGYGLWLHKPWSRIVVIVLSVLNLFSFPIGTLIGTFGIWFFGFEETAKSLFSGTSASSPMNKKKI